VERIATFRWGAKAPVVVDEELVVYDDGRAWLAVRAPVEQRGPIGSYVCDLSDEDLQDLAPYEGQSLQFVAGDTAASDAEARRIADQLAARCRVSPESLATFHVLPSGSPKDGRLNLALVAIGGGARPAEFELDHAACSVHFHAGREEVGWRECPEFPTGFVTAEAVGLGGVGRVAEIPPGSHGVIAFAVDAVAGATNVSMRVSGWLRAALPDAPEPARFSMFTDARNIEP
jgi:hypothetical protein